MGNILDALKDLEKINQKSTKRIKKTKNKVKKRKSGPSAFMMVDEFNEMIDEVNKK